MNNNNNQTSISVQWCNTQTNVRGRTYFSQFSHLGLNKMNYKGLEQVEEEKSALTGWNTWFRSLGPSGESHQGLLDYQLHTLIRIWSISINASMVQRGKTRKKKSGQVWVKIILGTRLCSVTSRCLRLIEMWAQFAWLKPGELMWSQLRDQFAPRTPTVFAHSRGK